MQLRSLFAALAIAAVSAPTVFAQEAQPLILDEESRVKVRVRGKEEKKPEVEPAPTPSPDEVIVAIVNMSVLTKADLEGRVAGRSGKIRNEILSSRGGVIATLDQNLRADVLPPEDDQMLEEQKRALDAALRQEMGIELQTWVEHRMLADEARRQGIVISQQDFQARLKAAEQENQLGSNDIDSILAQVRMSRADYEKSVYDALLIEKLLERFVSVNYTEEQFRAAYEKNPAIFREPARYRIAHFTVALDGSEDKKTVAALKEKAEKVRKSLAAGADPAVVFERDEFNEIEMGYWGSVPGWFDLNDNTLRPVVAAEIPKLKAGETSKVLAQMARRGTEVVPISYHVIKLMEYAPPTGDTFESALPTIRTHMIEIARTELLARLRQSGSHLVITNLGGVPPKKIPSPEELMLRVNKAEPINLKVFAEEASS